MIVCLRPLNGEKKQEAQDHWPSSRRRSRDEARESFILAEENGIGEGEDAALVQGIAAVPVVGVGGVVGVEQS